MTSSSPLENTKKIKIIHIRLKRADEVKIAASYMDSAQRNSTLSNSEVIPELLGNETKEILPS